MSDNWITVIPEDPRLVPDSAQARRASAWFRKKAPRAESVEVVRAEQVRFFDAGQNFERVKCAKCRRRLPDTWWQERMDEDEADGFKLAAYPVPCCGARQTLHQLIYDWPQGFGRFAIEVMNPGIGELTSNDRTELELLLGGPVRVIYRHL